LLTNGSGATIAGPSGAWRQTPTVPAAPSETLALPPTGQVDALTAAGGTLTVWQLDRSGGAWTRAQIVKVPIQYGSSE
jgi:hypothetical protein